MTMTKTTIIISELSKAELLKVSVTIKQYLVEYQKQHNLTEQELVENWSELPTLSRLVIIFTEEEYATEIHSHLSNALPNHKIHLSESLLRRHKSFDHSLQAPSNLDSIQSNLYEEPRPSPTPFESKLSPNEKSRTLFKPDLTLNTAALDEQKNTYQDPSSRERSPISPTITLEEVTKST